MDGSEAGPREESPEDLRVKAYYRRMWASLRFQMEACSSVWGSFRVSKGAFQVIEKHSRGMANAVHLESFAIQKTQATYQGQFRNITTCHPSFLYKWRCDVIRVMVKT